MTLLALDYRLALEHPAPAAVDAAVAGRSTACPESEPGLNASGLSEHRHDTFAVMADLSVDF
jgi:hypothetical protein